MSNLFSNVADKHAISIIEEFFWVHGLDYALLDMEQLIYYAMHHKYYKCRSPYTLVYFTEELRAFLPACLQLEKHFFAQTAFEVAPGEKGLPDLSRKEDYMPANDLPVWYYLPRHLSVAQYRNPMKALTQCRKYKTVESWKRCLDELLEYALSNSTIKECYPPYNILKLRRILLQLLEGSYLLLIRYQHSLANPEPTTDAPAVEENNPT